MTFPRTPRRRTCRPSTDRPGAAAPEPEVAYRPRPDAAMDRTTMAKTRRERILEALGFLVGAVVGVVCYGSVGVLALDRSRGLLTGLAFFLSFVGMLLGIVAPLALVRYLGGRGRSRVAKQLSTAGGYVAIVVMTVVVVAAGFFLAPSGFRDNPQVGLVVFDIVAGFVFGGILGHNAVSRRL